MKLLSGHPSSSLYLDPYPTLYFNFELYRAYTRAQKRFYPDQNTYVTACITCITYYYLRKVHAAIRAILFPQIRRFAQYNNTLLFTAANELAQLDKNGYAAFPCVKAFVRDLHNYQAECNSTMRRVPLIYSDVDTGGGAARKVVAEWRGRTTWASSRSQSLCFMVEKGSRRSLECDLAKLLDLRYGQRR